MDILYNVDKQFGPYEEYSKKEILYMNDKIKKWDEKFKPLNITPSSNITVNEKLLINIEYNKQ